MHLSGIPYRYKFSRDVNFADDPNLGFLRFYFRGSHLVFQVYLFIYFILFYCTGQADKLMMPRGQICPNAGNVLEVTTPVGREFHSLIVLGKKL